MKSLKSFNFSEHLSKYSMYVHKATVIAFVVQRGYIIAYGYNRKRFPTDGKFTRHAEMAALKKAGRRAVGATIYVYRFKKNNEFAYAKPCKDCMELIYDAEIAKGYCSNNVTFRENKMMRFL